MEHAVEASTEGFRELDTVRRDADVAAIAALAVGASRATAARLGILGSTVAAAELSRVLNDGVPGLDPQAMTCTKYSTSEGILHRYTFPKA